MRYYRIGPFRAPAPSYLADEKIDDSVDSIDVKRGVPFRYLGP